VLEVTAAVLGQIRREKTTAKRSMRSEVAVLTVADSAARIAALHLAEDDLKDAGGVLSLQTVVADEPSITVVLADEE
jgi:valyl-tRNA synthetase